MPKQNVLDQIAEELGEWIESTADALAEALVSSGDVAPFAANLTENQRLAYFSAQMYLPDGSVNLEGRNQLLQSLGPDGYSAVARTVLRSLGGLPPIPGMGA